MKIQFGLLEASPAWEQVFLQEGVPFDVVRLEEAPSAAEFSVLIVNHAVLGDELKALETYLGAGGAILAYAPFVKGLAGTTSRKEKIDYVLSDGETGPFDCSLLDVGVIGYIPREANVLRTQGNTFAAFAGKCAGGEAVILPFNVAELFTDIRIATKRFYHDRERIPSEQVSLVGRAELRHLLHRCFEHLHHARNMPYGHLWYYPAGRKTLLAFRVDTDGASRKDVDDLYNIAVGARVSMSWFLDVKSHEPWLNHFAFMAGQELGVHCYEHQVYPTYDANLKNLAKARRAMESSGLKTEGFVAPFGNWNPGLAEAVDELGFAYTSEFALGYDTLPFYPDALGIIYNTLQVPVHPVSIGSLRRAGYGEAHMRDYYRRVIDEKIARREPLFFYHHPSHRSWDVVRFILRYPQQQGIEPITMGEFARWWKQRLVSRCVLTSDGSKIHATMQQTRSNGDEPWIHLTMPGGRGAIIAFSPEIDVLGVPWSDEPRFVPPADIRRIRDFDPRTMLGDLYTEMMRKFS